MIDQSHDFGTPASLAPIFDEVETLGVTTDGITMNPNDLDGIMGFDDTVETVKVSWSGNPPPTLWGAKIEKDDGLLPNQVIISYTHLGQKHTRYFHYRCGCSNGQFREESFDQSVCVVGSVLAE
jgi:hypothetical protein